MEKGNDKRQMMSKVYFVGAGPGDPGLITIRALGILGQADCVIYDYLVDKRILDNANKDAELICCDELGKKRYAEGASIHNETISRLIIKKAKQGRRVIRLKSGDPAIFGRLAQELEPLVKEGIEFEVVPGVTAASAASCLNGIPLTDRRFSSDCLFATGQEESGKRSSYRDWNNLSGAGTIVLYMAVKNLPEIVKRLLQAGKSPDTRIAIVEDVSLLRQKLLTGTLKDITLKAKRQKIRPPAIIIIGETVKLEASLNWLRKNKRILFTGLSKERFFLKGTYFHLPLIEIKPLDDYAEFDDYLKNIGNFHWLVFSSRYGVEYFFQRLKNMGLDVRELRETKIAAVGNSTKMRLEDFGILADVVAKHESAQGLLEEFKRLDIKGKRIFLPRSDLSDKGLTNGLNKLGAKALNCIAYKNAFPVDLPDLDLTVFDEIKFTSPSVVRNFLKKYKGLPGLPKISCIGDATLREAKKWNLL